MDNKKRLFATMLSVCLALLLCASCGGDKPEVTHSAEAPSKAEASEIEVSTEEPGTDSTENSENTESSEEAVEGISYVLNGDTFIISGKGAMEDYEEYAEPIYYEQIAEAKQIIIEEGVTYIGNYAFRYAYEATSIAIPASVTSIGEAAFICPSFSSLESIQVDSESNAYSSVDGVLFSKDGKILIKYPEGKTGNKYVIPDGVTTISKNAFTSTDVTSNSLDANHLLPYHSLAVLEIPTSVTDIEDGAMNGCSGLAMIKAENNNNYTVSKDGVLFSKDGKILIKYPAGKTSPSYTIPEGVTTIGGGAFAYNAHLTNLKFSKNLKIIGDYAFFRCLNVKENNFVMPTGITSIGKNAFAVCEGISGTLTLPEGLTYLGDGAFSYCFHINKAILPSTLKAINDGTFCECRGMFEIIFSEGITQIGEKAFTETGFRKITLPSSINSIGKEAFVKNKYSRIPTIVFKGTAEQWLEVETGENWSSSATTVECEGGVSMPVIND